LTLCPIPTQDKNDKLEEELQKAHELIDSERSASEKIQENLDAENQALVEKLGEERSRMSEYVASMKEEKDELEDDLDRQRETHDVKVANANKIYEENAMLEKQLAIKMEKIEGLTEMNENLQEKLSTLSKQALAGAMRNRIQETTRVQEQNFGGSDEGDMSGLSGQERQLLMKLVRQGGMGGNNQTMAKDVVTPQQNWLQKLLHSS